MIVGIPPHTVFDLYPVLKPYFESFAERSHVGAEAFALDVANKARQCWIARTDKVVACALTQVADGIVEVSHCAGEGREVWQEAMMAEIEAWAKHIGATQVRTVNRPGWTPFLKALGYRETHRVMERDIGTT